MKKIRTRISVWDALVCIAVTVAAVLMIALSERAAGETVLIRTADESFTYRLSEARTAELHSNGHILTLEIRGGAVRIAESDCPDGICESAGWIRDPSEVIVCAPAKVLVQIKSSGGGTDADIIAGK